MGFFLVAPTVSKIEFWYSLVSGAIYPRSLVTKNEVLIYVGIIVKVTKKGYKVKSGELILAILGAIYSLRITMSVMQRIK